MEFTQDEIVRINCGKTIEKRFDTMSFRKIALSDQIKPVFSRQNLFALPAWKMDGTNACDICCQ